MARSIRLEIASEGFVFSPSLVLFAEYVCSYTPPVAYRLLLRIVAQDGR